MNKNNEQTEALNHSICGILSFIIAILFGIGFWISSMTIGFIGINKGYNAVIIGILFLVTFILHLLGILFGIIGCKQKDKKKNYAKSGLKLNILFLLLFVFVFGAGFLAKKLGI